MSNKEKGKIWKKEEEKQKEEEEVEKEELLCPQNHPLFLVTQKRKEERDCDECDFGIR